jgi:hypothetical protein
MSLTKQLRDRRSVWTFLVPIEHLTLTSAVDFEYRVNRVTFIAASALPRRRRRFGLPRTISFLRNRPHSSLNAFFDRAQTFATLRQSGTLADVEQQVLPIIREELALLTLSQLGFAKRRMMGAPMISMEIPSGRREYLVLDSRDDAWSQTFDRVGRYHTLRLEQSWLKFQRSSFFPGLLRIIRGQTAASANWVADIRTAAILVGQSQVSTDLAQAFLWNVIALERLLAQRGDTYTEVLPRRAEAFLGWVGYWKVSKFADRIKEIYRKRSALVHAGDRESIKVEDLFFTDDLMANLLLNLVLHTRQFPTKDAVVEFAERVEAERILGVRPRVRPRTLRFWHRRYSAADMAL